MNYHTYYFKFKYDAKNDVTGVYTKGWTGMVSVEAPDSAQAWDMLEITIPEKYPTANNVRDIKRRI